MKLKTLALSAVLLVGIAVSARAQVNGDLIVGFVPNGTVAQGTTTNLEVDLGSASGYIAAGPGTYTVANLGTDLTNTYGSSWASTTLSFGVVGAESGNTVLPTKSVWASSTDAGGLGSAAVYLSGGANYNNTAISHIIAMYSGLSGSFGGALTTPLSDEGSNPFTSAALSGLTVSTSTGGGWSTQQGLATPFSIPGGASAATLLTAVNSGNSADLEQILQGNAGATRDLGYFSLNTSTGDLTFTVIPEPTTYAAILGALTIGFVLIRRRNRALA